MSQDKVAFKGLKPFTPTYDRVYVSVEADSFLENNDFTLSEKNIKKLFSVINHSWDGDVYWFSDKKAVLESLDVWFQKAENHPSVDDLGISNLFLIKETPGGLCLIDTQLDMSSNIDCFLEALEEKNPGISYEHYSDSHLIDNMKLGRDSQQNEFDTLYLLYKEKVIDASYFLKGISAFSLDDSKSEYYEILPSDKTIVITGKLACERSEVLSELEEAGYMCSDTITHNAWLWYGDKVGKNKIEAAKEKNITCSSIDEVMDLCYHKYLSNKHKSSKKIKV